jgi:hypothetical protein
VGALKLEPLIRKRAKAQQATSTGGARPQLSPELAEAEPIDTREELAKVAGRFPGLFGGLTGVYPVCMMASVKLKRYNVHLDPEDLRALQELVEEVRLPVSQQIRCAIHSYLEKHRSYKKAERKRARPRRRS